MLDPDTLATTRRSLHAVGEHVLGAALFAGRHRIGLRQFTGGFATQNYLHIRNGAAVERRAIVVGTEVVVRDDDLAGGTIEERAPITTLALAGELVDVEPGMPATMYTPEPMPALDEVLEVDGDAAAIEWTDGSTHLATVQAALRAHATQVRVDGTDVVHVGGQREPIVTRIGLRHRGADVADV